MVVTCSKNRRSANAKCLNLFAPHLHCRNSSRSKCQRTRNQSWGLPKAKWFWQGHGVDYRAPRPIVHRKSSQMTAIPARHVGKAPAALASPLVPPLGLEHHHTLLPHLEEDRRIQPKHALDIQKHPMANHNSPPRADLAGHWAKKAGIHSSTRLHLFPVLQVQAALCQTWPNQ